MKQSSLGGGEGFARESATTAESDLDRFEFAVAGEALEGAVEVIVGLEAALVHGSVRSAGGCGVFEVKADVFDETEILGTDIDKEVKEMLIAPSNPLEVAV